MTLRQGLLSRAIARNKMLRYRFWRFDCVIFYNVPVPSDYFLNIVACTNMLNNFIYAIFRSAVAMFALSGSNRV